MALVTGPGAGEHDDVFSNEAQLWSVRYELDRLAERRRLAGLTTLEQARYEALGQRELELLRQRAAVAA